MQTHGFNFKLETVFFNPIDPLEISLHALVSIICTYRP